MRARCLAATLSVGMACSIPAWAGDTPEAIEQARTLFREAAAAEDARDWALAIQKYQASLAIKRSALTLHHLAVAQRESGALVAALGTFRAFVDEPQTDKSRTYLPEAAAAVAELERRVARVRLVVTSNLMNLSATLDGRSITPQLGQTILVDPGEHTVRVTSPGSAPFERRFILREGESNELTVELAVPPSPLKGASAERPAPTKPMALPIALMSGGGLVAIVGAAVGITGFVGAEGVEEGSPDATRLQNMGIVADVMVPTGSVAAGIGLILYFVLPGSIDQPAKAGGAEPSLSLGASTIGVQWRF